MDDQDEKKPQSDRRQESKRKSRDQKYGRLRSEIIDSDILENAESDVRTWILGSLIALIQCETVLYCIESIACERRS